MVIAVFLLLVAAVIVWDASLAADRADLRPRPEEMPYVVAAGMAVIAIGNLVLAWRGDFPERESYRPKGHRPHPRRLRRR